jgi:hypothetical protein
MLIKNRACGFAAVGAREAVYFLEYLFMLLMKNEINFPGVFFSKTVKEFFVLPRFDLRAICKIVDV